MFLHGIIFEYTKISFSITGFAKDIKPTTGFYEVSKLIAPEYLVEIEFTAVVN